MKEIYTNKDEPNSKIFCYYAIAGEDYTAEMRVLEEPDSEFIEWIKPEKVISLEGFDFHFSAAQYFLADFKSGRIQLGLNKGEWKSLSVSWTYYKKFLSAVDQLIKDYLSREEHTEPPNEHWECFLPADTWFTSYVNWTWVRRLIMAQQSISFKFGHYVLYQDKVYMVIGLGHPELLDIADSSINKQVPLNECTPLKLVEKEVNVNVKKSQKVLVRAEE